MPPDSYELEEFHQMLLKHIELEEQAEAAAEAEPELQKQSLDPK